MDDYKKIAELITEIKGKDTKIDSVKLGKIARSDKNRGIYPGSVHELGNCVIFIVRGESKKMLVVAGDETEADDFAGHG
ncbi:MAG: hypothetical protein PHX37_01770, partial [Eubacteriales bacterium]|nr:hypothetical protein [Eubacteriales bacterium]